MITMSSVGSCLDWTEEYEFPVTNESIDELVIIAAEGRSRGARVTFRGLRVRRIVDLLRIASAGGRWEGLLWSN
jgi:hypothetical protein